jgi:hypothetical protein
MYAPTFEVLCRVAVLSVSSQLLKLMDSWSQQPASNPARQS